MTIYVDKNGTVIAVDYPVDGATPVDIAEGTEEFEYYSKSANHQFVHADGTVTYSIIPPPYDKESTLEELHSEVSTLSDALNTLLGVND